MITGKLVDLQNKYYSVEHLQKGLQFLGETNFDDYSTGVHKDSEEFFFEVNEFETKETKDGFWEAHRKYLDFHYILQGTERIAIDHTSNQTVIEEYNDSEDVVLFDGEITSMVTLKPGDVMVCYPEDTHMTGLLSKEKEMVRKIVPKVKIK
ncbi:YhcH/YjgK/YiaL family protein [Evansella tamaricis]|uniref:YhcH/YjgK/YiaL family protein n=1 Tax=Evansella tamaricis TaxID=2069301 RepID=A0ABS6JD82_9BACI|nr:YhcH/YjgK/YiaL family protein [Evansella tamaricis]MBU9711631.1 YhcH/YjgK/YiaL family protein [Evansella tamaricis]